MTRRRNAGPSAPDRATEAALRRAMKAIAAGERAMAERDRLTVVLYDRGYLQSQIAELWGEGHGSRTWSTDAVARIVSPPSEAPARV